ncbi:hypothetical protein MWU50_03160 [Flavobacteriaceae bacterium S0862]|nr:hypothetical protein [Flavobacteriaceae bacterium S0862]
MNGTGVETIAANEPNLVTIILMEVLYATLITRIFSKWAQIKTFITSAKAGLIIGLFLGALPALKLFSTTTNLIDISGVLTRAITFDICFAVAGGVIGWLLVKE